MEDKEYPIDFDNPIEVALAELAIGDRPINWNKNGYTKKNKVLNLIAHQSIKDRKDELEWVFDNAPYDDMRLWEARVRKRLAKLDKQESQL